MLFAYLCARIPSNEVPIDGNVCRGIGEEKKYRERGHRGLSAIERIYIPEGGDTTQLYGVNRCNLTLLKHLFPKVRIYAAEGVLKLLGHEEEIERVVNVLDALSEHIERYNTLEEETIRRIAAGELTTAPTPPEHHIIYGVRGKSISARGEHQQAMVRAFEEKDMLFAVGPAGTGKTYIAISLAVKALKERKVRRIILSRPAVEAGEKLGFLPGEMKDKLDPYLQPLYDALEEMIPFAKLKDYMEQDRIQIAPLAYMRGRTLSDAVIILDEAQNTSVHQMKMFLTRLGFNSKMIVTGDITQIDLPRGVPSGLMHALKVLGGIEDIAEISFTREDIVRHALVGKIVDAYERAQNNNKEQTTE